MLLLPETQTVSILCASTTPAPHSSSSAGVTETHLKMISAGKAETAAWSTEVGRGRVLADENGRIKRIITNLSLEKTR